MKNMTYEQAQDKVVKLLRKSKSTNAAEAASFAAKAQEIMDRYSIEVTAADLDAEAVQRPDEPIQNFDREAADQACQKDKLWTVRLTGVVGNANGCRSYWKDFNGGCLTFLIGRASDVATARYMIGLLSQEVRRLNREHCQGYSEKYRRDFKYGVVDAIAIKLQEGWQQTTFDVRKDVTNHLALVRLNNAIVKLEQRLQGVEDWEKKNMQYKKQGKSQYNAKDEARTHGRKAGETIKINRAKGGLTSGAKALKEAK